MICFDSTYIAHIYLMEPGSTEVRAFAAGQERIASCELGLAEVASVLHRKLRENAITRAHHAALASQFEVDVGRGVWNWLPVSSAIMAQVRIAYRDLPPEVFLRAADAIHLVCAREAGVRQIYTNDRHMLAAAPHFRLAGINVIPGLIG